MDHGSASAGATPRDGAPRCIVVSAAILDGVPRLFALSAERARLAIADLAALDPAFSEPAADGPAEEGNRGWRIVEQEVDVIPLAVEVVMTADGTELRWTCPACGRAWCDEWAEQDELPVLLLCDCGGTANTWCLGEAC